MGEERAWKPFTLDLYSNTELMTVPGVVEVKFRRMKHREGEVGSSTELTVKNLGQSAMDFKLEWHNSSEKEKGEIHRLKIGKRKRVVVPPVRGVTLWWRLGD